jgi:hypothetical protein
MHNRVRAADYVDRTTPVHQPYSQITLTYFTGAWEEIDTEHEADSHPLQLVTTRFIPP